MESPCSIHQASVLVSVHCLTLLDKQALYLLVAQGKLPFTLCYPVKYFLTTTLQAAESLLVPTALELVNNSIATQLLQKHAVKGAPSRSCPTGSQSKGHPARVGGLSPTSVNPIFYKLGLQPLTAAHFCTYGIKYFSFCNSFFLSFFFFFFFWVANVAVTYSGIRVQSFYSHWLLLFWI